MIIISQGRIGLDKNLAELATDAAHIVVEVRGPADQVAKALQGTDGVANVVTQPQADGVVSFEVRTHQDRDLRESISQRLAQHGWPLRRLDLRRRTLEDHFLEVVVRQQNAFQAVQQSA